MAEVKKTEILLESGTNELEVMEFTIANMHFGINVSKVVEIMQYNEITSMPNSNPFVEGVFKPRDEIMTVIDLALYMSLPASTEKERDILIITNFNKTTSAFHVHTVEAIHRISWQDIEKPDSSIYGGEEGLATGIARFDGRLITIVDFEKILVDISPASSIKISDLAHMGERAQNSRPILVAEDSPLLERMILQALEKAGFTNITLCSNGKEAWDHLYKLKSEPGAIEDHISIVVTDIEMPQMDGHRLTKLIKDDPILRVVPVIIFSSLINDEMYIKGESVGASAQITKPEITSLVTLIDKYMLY